MGTRQYCRRSASEWKKIIDKYPGSGLKLKAYCRRCGISDKSFYSWRTRLARKPSGELKDFIEVPAVRTIIKESLRIETPGGYRLQVPPGSNVSFVKQIVSALNSQ